MIYERKIRKEFLTYVERVNTFSKSSNIKNKRDKLVDDKTAGIERQYETQYIAKKAENIK